jgi:hypothetical protein
MRIFIDETACDVRAGSVSQALAGAAAVARERGRAIVDVVIDGRHCAADGLDYEQLRGVAASEIRLTTADCRQLVRQAFDHAAAALSEADRLQQAAAELIQADQGQEAMQRLGEALNIWSNVRAAVLMGAEMAGIDLFAEAGDGKGNGGNQAVVTALSERLRSLREALTNRDTVALADTLLYDLPDVIAAWRAMLCDLQQRVGGETRPGSTGKAKARAKVKRHDA